LSKYSLAAQLDLTPGPWGWALLIVFLFLCAFLLVRLARFLRGSDGGFKRPGLPSPDEELNADSLNRSRLSSSAFAEGTSLTARARAAGSQHALPPPVRPAPPPAAAKAAPPPAPDGEDDEEGGWVTD
jgi:hypothetical protein